ncbi:AAA family ATPase [Agarivorans sp. Z349TD_8]|uniref:AAA family ATPase n=1 Tax=Agarivorans sp. Z349TD_8 TaxID=3421434 RepID=UPI003D7D4A1B
MTNFEIPLDKLQPTFNLANVTPNSHHQWADLMPLAKASFDYFLSQAPSLPLMLCQAASYLQHQSILQALLRSPTITSAPPSNYVMLYRPKTPYQPSYFQLKTGSLPLFKQLMQQLNELIRAEPASSISVQAEANESLFIQLHSCQQQLGLVDAVQDLYHALIEQQPANDISAYYKVWQSQHQPILCPEFSRAALFGSIRSGSSAADLTGIDLGLFQQSPHGVFVLNSDDVIADPGLWFELKACLKSSRLDWSRAKSHKATMIPEASDFKPKLVLLGEPMAISALLELDPEIYQLSLIETELPSEVELNSVNIEAYLSQINATLSDTKLAPLDAKLYTSVLGYASRLCEHNDLLSLDILHIIKPLRLLAHLQLNHNAEGFASALNTLHRNINSQQQFSDLAYRDQQTKIELSGEKIGQINGLSVIDFNGLGLSFGEPIRITATAHQGEGDFTDVERKAELGGNIHAKSMMIIQGYLSELFAKEHHFPLSGNIVFEQSYHEIDGDSASMAGALVMMSALANLPIKQSFAVTGALDQKGNILAVGGLNEKIEGFYRIAQQSKIAGPFALILPKANLNQLNLNHDVIQACTQGKLKLFAIEHIEQAVQLLFNQPAGDVYDAQSVYGQIHRNIHPEGQNNSFFAYLLRKILGVFKL